MPISCLLFLFACNSAYKNLQPTTGNVNSIQKFRPVLTSALYKAEVNVADKYLSGLVIIKKMPDSSVRVLFSNEMGLKFFDFGFFNDGSFKVYYIMEQINKKAVIKTLRKDFELILMRPLNTSKAFIRKDDHLFYYIFPQSKGFNTYITNSAGDKLVRMERSSKRKPVVEVVTTNYNDGLPDSIAVTHKNFDFTIGLKRIER